MVCVTFVTFDSSKYPPFMAIIGNPKSQQVKYKGISVDLAEYIAQYLNSK